MSHEDLSVCDISCVNNKKTKKKKTSYYKHHCRTILYASSLHTKRILSYNMRSMWYLSVKKITRISKRPNRIQIVQLALRDEHMNYSVLITLITFLCDFTVGGVKTHCLALSSRHPTTQFIYDLEESRNHIYINTKRKRSYRIGRFKITKQQILATVVNLLLVVLHYYSVRRRSSKTIIYRVCFSHVLAAKWRDSRSTQYRWQLLHPLINNNIKLHDTVPNSGGEINKYFIVYYSRVEN